MTLSVNFLWDTLRTIFLYFILSFEFSHLLVHLLMEIFCYLLVFQRLIVGCWVVDVLLFSKLSLQVSLLVHFLQYLDGLGSILIWCFVLLDWSLWGSYELLLQFFYASGSWSLPPSLKIMQSFILIKNTKGVEYGVVKFLVLFFQKKCPFLTILNATLIL